MRILALEPYYGGSHKAFIDGWSAVSTHDWSLYKLAPYKWKWRMRHSAVTFAERIKQFIARGDEWDVIFCSDMLNLAEFLGLSPQAIQKLPAVVYFHENQLTYPVRCESERDYQFAMTNMTTALAAKSVWFNSAFHRDSFLEALATFLQKMPDCRPTDAIECIRSKTLIYPPGVKALATRTERRPGPLRILWAARWEHDKNPDDFFEALKIVKARGVDFRVSVIGQQFHQVPDVFEWAHQHFYRHIDRWGYQQSSPEYENALKEADVFVSTATHEFFGISAVEACLAGAYPLLPKRLAYPEILNAGSDKPMDEFFYDGGVSALADRLITLANRIDNDSLWRGDPDRLVRLMQKYKWDNLGPLLDQAIVDIAERV